jgi:transposase
VSNGDLKLLLTAITALCTLQQKFEDNDVTLHKMRKLLGMVQQSECRRTEAKSKNRPSDFNNSKKGYKPKPKPKIPVSHHKMDKFKSGQQCPDCPKGSCINTS